MNYRFLVFVGLLGLALPAHAVQRYSLQYGVPAGIHFYQYDVADGTYETDEADDGDDATVYCLDGAGAASANDYTADTNGSGYKLTLTAAEMACAILRIEIVETDTGTTVLIVETFGDVDAFDTTKGLASGVAQAGTATTLQLRAAHVFTDHDLKDHVIQLTGGAGAGQTALITGYVGTTDTATLSVSLDPVPDTTTEYMVLPTNQGVIQQTTPGIADVHVVSFAANALDSDATHAGYVTEVQSGLATSSAQTAIQADIDDLTAAALGTFLNCQVNTAFFAGDSDQFACILSDLDGGAVTQATGDLEGLQVVVTSGDQIREARFINDTTWDAGNSELQVQLSRALPATLADAVTVVIR